jgi:hypothetical protein
MAVLRTGAVRGRDGGQPVTGRAVVTHGRQPAVCRRCKGGAASPGCGESPAGAWRLPCRAHACHLACLGRDLA